MRSNTDLDIYILQGEVPETLISGGTYDIRQLCEHGFYDWVMFMDKRIQHPNKNPVLGRYLGPAINVGLTITAKITKENGELVHSLTYCGPKDDDKSNQSHV